MRFEKTGFGTRAVHAGQPPDPTTGAVMTPIYQNSTYAQRTPGELKEGYDYGRTNNPTRRAYETCIAALEKAHHALAFSAGVAAIDACMHRMRPGDHVLSCDDVYGGTFRIFDGVYKKHGVEISFVDMTDLKKVEASLRSNTKMVWLETPTNPLLKLLDIKKIAAAAKKSGAITVVDNTFMSPYFQNPLELGAEIALHSVTKFMNGHSDVIGGAIATNDKALFQELQFIQKSCGAIPSPMDCFLAMRGLKTLHVRMQRHEENAAQIARLLDSHPQVEKVIYPGLESHPQHALAKEQMSGFGGMITFYLRGGLPEARKFLEKVRIFTLAESLGGVESLVDHPALMTHTSVPPEVRADLGITDNLVRLSVGIEEAEDLMNDLKQALG